MTWQPRIHLQRKDDENICGHFSPLNTHKLSEVTCSSCVRKWKKIKDKTDYHALLQLENPERVTAMLVEKLSEVMKGEGL